MEWIECSYDEACRAQAAGHRVQIALRDTNAEWWADRDTPLIDYPMSYGQGHWKFRYKASTEQPKSKPHLFPPKALQLAGEVLAFGEEKYPDEKWKRMSADDHIGACLRHLLEHLSGNSYDAESHKLHLTHSLVRLGMALEQYITQR